MTYRFKSRVRLKLRLNWRPNNENSANNLKIDSFLKENMHLLMVKITLLLLFLTAALQQPRMVWEKKDLFLPLPPPYKNYHRALDNSNTIYEDSSILHLAPVNKP
jgi:hypothetical protein